MSDERRMHNAAEMPFIHPGVGMAPSRRICMAKRCGVPRPLLNGRGVDGAWRCGDCVALRLARATREVTA